MTQPSLVKRFRGFLPIVIDIETGGFEPSTDAILEIAAVIIDMDEHGLVYPASTLHYHIEPFNGANLDPRALEFTGIDPYHPFRFAVPEQKALHDMFKAIRKAMKHAQCQRAILVAHNAIFDLSFINAAIARCQIKRSPLHRFTSFDTATLGALAYGQTVLAKALKAAGITFDPAEAHSALYDAERTAELFCKIVNRWQDLGGWPP